MGKFKDFLKGQETLSQKEKRAEVERRRWEREKLVLESEQQIEEERYALKKRSWDRKLPFVKILMIFLFINFTILEIFTGWVTISSFTLAYAIGVMPDFTPLITLLGAIIGETLSFGIYSAKAKAENTKGGIVFESAMREMSQENAVG